MQDISINSIEKNIKNNMQILKEEEEINLKLNKVYNDDCLRGLKHLKNKSVDFILSDPPYGIKFNGKAENYNRKSDNVLNNYFEIESKDYYSFSKKWLIECKRILKDNGTMFVFSGWTNLNKILNVLEELNFEIINHIIWKYQFGVVTKNKFTSSHYHILYVKHKEYKGKITFNRNSYYADNEKNLDNTNKRYKDMEDVWYIKREYIRNSIKAPTKLPSELVEKILRYCTNEKDIVLDPFMGSGETAVTSKKINRNFIGFEINQDLFELINKRLNGELNW